MLTIENFIAGAQIDIVILLILEMGDLLIRGPNSIVGSIFHRFFHSDEEGLE
jgi:hypothetical protein